MSIGAKDLISKLLVYEPSKRLTAHEALRHHWVKTVMGEDDWVSYGVTEGSAAMARGEKGDDDDFSSPRRKPPKLLWRGGAYVAMAAHRLVYIIRCKQLKLDRVDFPFTRDFGFVVSRVFSPSSAVVSVSGMCPGNIRALQLVADMVESNAKSPAVLLDTLDMSNNGIDNLDLVQNIVKVVTSHPGITSLSLEGNPIPPLAGRALHRLARSTARIRSINLKNTGIPPDTVQQIALAIKENDKKRGEATAASPPPKPSGALTAGTAKTSRGPSPGGARSSSKR